MVLDPARKPSAGFPPELLGNGDSGGEDSPRAPPWVPAAAAPRREALAPLAEHPGSDRRVSWSPGAADVESENEDDVACSAEINQCVAWSDDAASDDEDEDDDVTRACLDLLRGGRATRWRSARAAFLALRLRPASASVFLRRFATVLAPSITTRRFGAVEGGPRNAIDHESTRRAGAPDAQSVTPRCLRKAFRDLFAVDLDASEALKLARALGNGAEEVSYATFAAALDNRSVPYGDAAPERERNPVNPEPELPEPEPGFSAAAADAAFRENLLAAHETIARSWLALRRLQDDDRRDLSYAAFERGLDLYGVGVSGGEAEAIYALYVGAPAALRRRPLAFAAFARRFADGGVLRPGLRASARAFRRAPVQ